MCVTEIVILLVLHHCSGYKEDQSDITSFRNNLPVDHIKSKSNTRSNININITSLDSFFEWPIRLEDTWPFGEVEDTFPWWFHDPNNKGINSALLNTKISCSWDPITETQSCDYTEARKTLRGYCDRNRDSFYSLSGTMTCASWSWEFTNFPFCQDQYAPSGNIYNIINSGYFDYKTFCTNEFTNIRTMSHVVNHACYVNNDFTTAAGNGDPFYAWELESAGTCSSYANKDICDYYSLVSELKESCESQGGLMYRWSAREFEIDAFRSRYDIYKNMPVCLSTD